MLNQKSNTLSGASTFTVKESLPSAHPSAVGIISNETSGPELEEIS